MEQQEDDARQQDIKQMISTFLQNANYEPQFANYRDWVGREIVRLRTDKAVIEHIKLVLGKMGDLISRLNPTAVATFPQCWLKFRELCQQLDLSYEKVMALIHQLHDDFGQKMILFELMIDTSLRPTVLPRFLDASVLYTPLGFCLLASDENMQTHSHVPAMTLQRFISPTIRISRATIFRGQSVWHFGGVTVPLNVVYEFVLLPTFEVLSRPVLKSPKSQCRALLLSQQVFLLDTPSNSEVYSLQRLTSVSLGAKLPERIEHGDTLVSFNDLLIYFFKMGYREEFISSMLWMYRLDVLEQEAGWLQLHVNYPQISSYIWASITETYALQYSPWSWLLCGGTRSMGKREACGLYNVYTMKGIFAAVREKCNNHKAIMHQGRVYALSCKTYVYSPVPTFCDYISVDLREYRTTPTRTNHRP